MTTGHLKMGVQPPSVTSYVSNMAKIIKTKGLNHNLNKPQEK
jgi:hypothetical protein